MPVKVRCPKCEKVLNAPDAARGKAVRCPQCQSRVKVPGERPKPAVAKAAGPDSTSFLINLNAGDLEDRKNRICPKCGADVGEEDADCPECGVNLETGVMSERTRQRRSESATDATKFFKEMARDAFRYWLANKSLAVRTALYLVITSSLSMACLVMFMWCVHLPPKAFWGLCAFVTGLVGPGWVMYLHLQILRNTYDRKKKVKRINFDFFLSAALGFRLLVWTIFALAHFGLTIGLIGAALIWFDMRVAGYVVLGCAALPVFLIAPIAFSHMTMPVQAPAWKVHKLLGAFLRTWKGVLYWCLFFVLTNIPALAGAAAVIAYYQDDVRAFNDVLASNYEVQSRRSAVQTDEDAVVQKASVQNQLAKAGTEQDVPWSSLIIPAVGWLACCTVFGLTSVFDMRSNGLFALYFRHGLDMVTQAQETVYVSRSADMFVDEKPTTVMMVWAVFVFAILGCVALSFTLKSIILTLLAILGVSFLFVPLAGLWRIFEKAGEPGWGAVVPRKVSKTLLRGAGYEEWYWPMLLAVPGYGQYIWCKAWVAMAARFQKGQGFGVGLAFAPFIFHPLLGFSSTRCLKPEYVNSGLNVDGSGGASSWTIAGYVLGGMFVLGLMVVLVIGLLPPSVVGLVTGAKVEPPKEYELFRPMHGDFACKNPKGWKVELGGGAEGVPQWAQFSQGSALIRIQEGTPGTTGSTTVNKALGMGNEVQQGTAGIEKVHEYYAPTIANSLRMYEEGLPKPVEHEFGQALAAEFTSTPLFGPKIKGVHGTLLIDAFQYTIQCRCAESDFEALKPAFMFVIDSITPWKMAAERWPAEI